MLPFRSHQAPCTEDRGRTSLVPLGPLGSLGTQQKHFYTLASHFARSPVTFDIGPSSVFALATRHKSRSPPGNQVENGTGGCSMVSSNKRKNWPLHDWSTCSCWPQQDLTFSKRRKTYFFCGFGGSDGVAGDERSSVDVQGYLAHKETPTPLGPP